MQYDGREWAIILIEPDKSVEETRINPQQAAHWSKLKAVETVTVLCPIIACQGYRIPKRHQIWSSV
jgi:hypothetical protein